MFFYMVAQKSQNGLNSQVSVKWSAIVRYWNSTFVKSSKSKKVQSAIVVGGDAKSPFSIATTQRCGGGRYYFPWIAPLYPWSVIHNAEC